jgi:hypothetical protein
LGEHVGIAIYVSADVYHYDRFAGTGGENASDGGTIDTFDFALDHLGDGHTRAGIASGDEAMGETLSYKPGADVHGAIFLGTRDFGRRIFHCDSFGSVNDFNRKMPVFFMLFQFGLDQVTLADEQDFYSQGLGGTNGAFHFWFRRVISAQGVEGDRQHKLLLSDFDYFAALILATVRAHAVRELLLMAVGAFGEAHFFQSIMCAAFAGARGGVSTFWIRHGLLILFPA